MCRLFAMTTGRERVRSTFWLLGAPDSVAEQSRRNPDGTGLGTFDVRGDPRVEKQALRAVDDQAFAREAKDRESAVFVAHVRRATSGGLSTENTHPFAGDRLLFAHNGAISDVPVLEEELGAEMAQIHGDTDSERIFALVRRETRRAEDPGAGLVSAVTWLADNVGVVALNVLLASSTDLWALRYPEARELYVLDRRHPADELDKVSSEGMRIRSSGLARTPAVVVASEPMDREAWSLLAPGEMLHVDRDLGLRRDVVVPDPPQRQVTEDQLDQGAGS